MLSKKISRYAIWVLGVVFAVSIGIELTAGDAMAGRRAPEGTCWNDRQFTREFSLDKCGGFSATGANPFFSLNPGYQLVLASEEEKAEITYRALYRLMFAEKGGRPKYPEFSWKAAQTFIDIFKEKP